MTIDGSLFAYLLDVVQCEEEDKWPGYHKGRRPAAQLWKEPFGNGTRSSETVLFETFLGEKQSSNELISKSVVQLP